MEAIFFKHPKEKIDNPLQAIKNVYELNVGGGIDVVYWKAKELCPKVTRALVKRFLLSTPTHALYVQPVRRYRRAPTVVFGPGVQYQIDLVEVHQIQAANDGVRYLLCCIDVFSRKVWVAPLKTKTAKEVLAVFEKLLTIAPIPKFVQSDRGKEFLNSIFQKFLASKGIKFFTTHGDTKASVVERFNRTLRSAIAKRIERNDNDRYLDCLQVIVKNYNQTFHRSIGMAPVEVNNKNRGHVWVHQYGEATQPPRNTRKEEKENPFRFNLGDQVRLVLKKGNFGRGYVPQWTQEIFTIYDRQLKSGSIPVYLIKDGKNINIEGFFYDRELLHVPKLDK